MVNIIEERCDGKDDGDDDFADDHYNISSKDDNITTTDIDITQGKNAILNYHHHCFHNFQHFISTSWSTLSLVPERTVAGIQI